MQENVEDLISLLNGIFLTKTRAEWLRIFHDRGLLFEPIQEMNEVLEDPQALANGYLIDYQHPWLGLIRIPGYPISFSASAVGTRAPAPDLGEHTVAILSELGYTTEDVDRLKTKKVVK